MVDKLTDIGTIVNNAGGVEKRPAKQSYQSVTVANSDG